MACRQNFNQTLGRIIDGDLYALFSAKGELVCVDVQTGEHGKKISSGLHLSNRYI